VVDVTVPVIDLTGWSEKNPLGEEEEKKQRSKCLSSSYCYRIVNSTAYEMEDTTSGGQDPSNILLMSKIGAMVGLGFGSLALGTLPLMVGRYRAKKQLRQKRHQKRRQAMSSNSNTSTSTSTSDASPPHVDSASAANKQVRPRNDQKS